MTAKKKDEKALGKEQYNAFAKNLGLPQDEPIDTIEDEEEEENGGEGVSHIEGDTIQFEEGMKRFNEDGEEDEEGAYDDEGREIVFEENSEEEDGVDKNKDTVVFEEGMKRYNEEGEEDDDGAYDEDGKEIVFAEEIEGGSVDDLSDADIASLMVETFKEKTGIEVGEDRKFESVDDFVALMQDVIEANSEPKYSSDKIKELDEFVRQGGKLEDFLKTEKSIVSLEKVDLDNEQDQKSVVKKFYEDKGLSNKKVERIIDAMDDEELEDEAKEMHGQMLEAEKENKLKSKKEKEKEIEKQQQAQEKFVKDYQGFVDKFDSFNGVKLSNKDKENVLDYVLGVDKKTNKTKSQLDFDENPYEVLAQLALVRTKKDLLSGLGKKAETDAVKKFRNKLRKNSSKQKVKSGKSGIKQRSGLDIIKSEVSKLHGA